MPVGNFIDNEMIKLSGKRNPRLLFIPTASEYPNSSSMTSEDQYKEMQDRYERKYGCKTDVLYLVKKRPSKSEIRRKVFDSDLIYVGGGSTLKLLKTWRRLGVDKILKEASERGIAIYGVSAGAICWFKYAHTRERENGIRRYMKIQGLGFFPLALVPHYHDQPRRRPSLFRMIKKYGGSAVAMEIHCAIEIIDDKYRIVSSSQNACAYIVYRYKGKVFEEKMIKDLKFRPLSELSGKQN